MTNDGWMPIGTVPYTGDPVMVYLQEELLGSRMHVGVFRRNVSLIAGHFAYDVPKPTHWRPLPAPPAEGE